MRPLLVSCVLLLCCHRPVLAEDSSASDIVVKQPSPAESPSVSEELPRIPPTAAADALATFRTLPGFQLQLVAAEPLVHDPVAMSFDERGRLFVVEMCDYSEQDHDFLGVIRLLEDTDGDGRFDKSTPFADQLSWPTAVICYDGGVFVGAAPNIWFLKDTDGDGRADQRRRVFTGFGRSNVQGLLNSFNWGLDNRIHGATSSSGGQVRRADLAEDDPGNKAVSLNGRDFAFDPKTLELTPTSGGAQHGLTFDDWGRKYVCSNSDHIQLIMFEDRYAARNPYLPAPNPRLSIAADGAQAEVYRISPVEPWRIVRTRLRVAGAVPGPIEGGGRAAGYFTSATGVTIYRGAAWPDAYHGNALIGDVGSNIVHRKVLEPKGIEFVARRGDPQREFVASRDIWFRPAQFANAPDGTLYIADVYREVIEHPASLPPVIKEHLDLTSGRDRGRIYRVVQEGFEQSALPRFDQASTLSLVSLLENPNGWHRDTAARLIFARQDPAALEPLKRLYRSSRSPLGRLHALYALSGSKSLTDDILLASLTDEHPRVREHAVRLSETRVDRSPELRQKLISLVSDPDPRVRYQLAFTLGELPSAERFAGLAAIARRDASDRWVRFAILSSATDGAGKLFATLLTDLDYRTIDANRQLLEDLAAIVGRQGDTSSLAAVLASVDQLPDDEGELLVACLLSLSNVMLPGKLNNLLSQSGLTRLTTRMNQASTEARSVVADGKLSVEARLAAIRLLDLGPAFERLKILFPLLTPQEPPALQLAALRALSNASEIEVADELIVHWSRLSPTLRAAALEILFSRADRLPRLLTAIEEQQILAGDVDPARAKLLLTSNDLPIRQRAEKLFASVAVGKRAQIVEDYRPALALTGDVTNGKKVFQKSCATCHKLEGFGHEIGPNLATIQNRGPETILVNVLDPNREVNPQFVSYVLVTNDGRSITGMISSETVSSIILVRAEQQTDTVLRSQIDTLQSSGMSLMPEGVEKDLDRQALADLIAYLMSIK